MNLDDMIFELPIEVIELPEIEFPINQENIKEYLESLSPVE